MTHYIAVWDVTFYKVDEDGDALTDNKGNVQLFYERHPDYTYLSEGLDDDDLEEIKS